MILRRTLSGCLLFLFFTLLGGSLLAQSVSGIVTNRTTNKPSGNDDVVLLQLAQGMQELARTKTDNRGRFTIAVPADGLHLLRVTHEKANYFKPIQPGTQSVDIDVYSAAAEVQGVTTEADVLSLQSESGGDGLKVVEHFFLKNESAPPKTLMSEHPFEFYLPAGATVLGAASKAPGGMAVQAAPVPMGAPDHYTILFAIRPGQTEFQVTYHLNYKDSLTFHPRPATPIDNFVLILPKSMSFKPGASTPYTSVDEEPGAQTYVARNVQPSQPLEFTVGGSGQLPRDNGAPGTGGTSTNPSAVQADPNTDTRPGGGLGTPVDKDAQRDPWTKYRWWIIAGVALAFAAGAGFMLRTPTPARTAAVASPASVSAGPHGALQILRDEMFTLETDRMTGKLSDGQYSDLKAAYDTVLKRTLDRAGAV